MTVTIGGVTETLTVVDHQGPQVSVVVAGQTVMLDTVERVVTVALQGVQGPQGPAGSGSTKQDLTFTYTGSRLDLVTGQTFNRTLTYDGSGRVETVTDSDTGVIQTLSYDGSGRLASRVVT